MISQLCSAPAVWHQYHTKASCLMRSIRAPDREPLRLPCSSWQYPLTCAEPQQVHDILSPPHYCLFLTFSIDSPDPAPILRIASAAAHTPVSLSRPVAAGLARPLILSFSCCCLQEPLCFLLPLPAASLATHSPIFPPTSFWTCLYAPRMPASWSPACWSESRLSELTAKHATLGVTILEKVIASRCPLTFHHLTRCYMDRAVSIFSNHHCLYHLTHSGLTHLS